MAEKSKADKSKAAPKAAAPKSEPQSSKLSQFLASKKLDARRLVAASKKLERLQPEDRKIKLNKRLAKKAEGDNAPKETRKPRSGRPVTPRAISAALTGKSVSGPTKNRILRAVNHLLEQKKQEKVELKALF